MRARDGIIGLALLCGLGGLTGAEAAEVYNYTVHHPSFGNIGTYTDRIDRGSDGWQVVTTLHIAVRVLGIVMHREDAERTEVWSNDRLTRFDGVTTTNGSRVEVHGEAQADGFAVRSPSGDVVGPIDLVPSDPWQASRGGANGIVGVMLSTKSGRLERVRVAGGELAVLSVDGLDVPVRHFAFSTDKRQDVWLDARGVPIRFRTMENGTAIDFVLSREQVAQLPQ
jgi:hypothetical protein